MTAPLFDKRAIGLSRRTGGRQYPQNSKLLIRIKNLFFQIFWRSVRGSLQNRPFLKQRSRGIVYYSSTVIRQKREPQKGCSKKTKHVKFSEKTNMSYPQGVRNVLFFGEFGGVLCFLETPVLRFALLLYYRRVFTENFLLLSRKISSFYG